jgi:Uma2 family endonuclease
MVMTQAKPRFATFEEYLSYSNDLEGRFQLINGELIELPPESRLNSTIAFFVALVLARTGIAVELIHPGKCEIQVPVLAPGDAANRYPDLVVLRWEHLELTQRRLTITLDMPPPQWVMEVVSPGKTNRARDYINKRSQYAAIGVPEYWLIDPKAQTIMVLELEGDDYREIGTFQGIAPIVCPTFPTLTLSAEQIFQP